MIRTATYSFVLGGVFLLPFASRAEDSALLSTLSNMLDTSEHTVESWETQAAILITLAVVVGAAGVITGMLQGFKRSHTRPATVVLGAIVSITTVVTTTVFPADHRTFKQIAASGRVELRQMRLVLNDLRAVSAVENQRALRDEFMKHYDAVTKLEMYILGRPAAGRASSTDGPSFVPAALAQERVLERTPDWVRSQPRDTDTSRFFVGTGDAADLESARELSLRHAQDQVVGELARGVAKGVASVDVLEELRLRDLVSKLGEVANTAFTFDKERVRFRYWTLLRLNPRFFNDALLTLGDARKPAPAARILPSAHPQYFNANRTLRVEYANVFVEQSGKATLSFQAAATIRARFPGQTGPSVSLMFVDKDKKPLGPFREVAHVSVDSCGGYQAHQINLNDKDFSRDVLDRAGAFVLQMPGSTSPLRCDRGSIPPSF